MTSRQLGRDSQVWDPGARILIYSEHNNNNNINTVTGRNPSGGHLNVCANFNAKEKIRCLMQSSKPVSTRASPNKSQDSGFSDSGESESSSNNSEGNKASGHVTKVYFYSNNSESHYQSPSSLPVYSSVTKINTATGNSCRHERANTHTLTVPDSGGRAATNKKELKNIVLVQGDSRNHNIISSVSVDGSYHPAKMRIYNRANSRSLYSPDSRASPPASGVERNFVTRRSWTPSSLGSSGSGGDTRMDGHQSPTQSPPRLNSIAELLEHFRKEDPSHGDDMKAVGNLPIYNSSPSGSSSSSSLSPGSESEVSSVSMDSAKDIKDEVSGLGPVDHWLSELPSLCESECSVMLQSKSLQGLHKVPAFKHQIYQDIRIIQDNAREVTKSFAELCRLLSGQTRKEKLVSSIKYLEYQVQSLINLNCVTKFRLSGSQFGELQSLPGLRIISGSGNDFGSLESEHNNVIMREHQKILSYLHDLKFCAAHGHSRKGHVSEMVQSATQFGSCITVLVEEMLSTKVGHIVTSLEPSTGHTRDSLEQSLVSITSLGLEGNHLCRLMTKHGAVSFLVSLLSQENCLVRAATLRALATLCSVLEAIRQLEEVRGVEVIARLLGDLTISEADRAEAAGVLAQVTSPWIEDNDYVLGVTENAFTLVRDLTTMCAATKCDETFLLGSAALANLSFLSPLILTAMSAQDTVLTLLQYLTHNVSPSIYIQDQVATVLANMAARHDTQESLLSCNIVAVLLHLLAASPGSEDLPILAATQRVQQKAAIAIGRLSAQPGVMSGLMSGAGLERLVELSVCKKARLDSDSTLVAVITAVRKISQSQNISHLLTNLGASELLESCLLSSFKLFSTKHESFV